MKCGIPAWVLFFSFFHSSGAVAQTSPRNPQEVDVRGRVLASFDEDHAIINTGKNLVRISTKRLSFVQRQKLALLPMNISLRIPPDSIDLVWKLEPGPGQIAPLAVLEKKEEDSLNSHDGIVEIRGRKLTSMPGDMAFVQVNDLVYVVQKSKVPAESRSRLDDERVNVYVPQSSLLFSWKMDKVPPSTEPPAKDELRVEGKRIRIVGHSVLSFEDPYSLVQASGSVLRLRRKNLSGAQRSELDHVGNNVSMRVPSSSVSAMWTYAREKSTPLSAPR